jgi:hypothetical protein
LLSLFKNIYIWENLETLHSHRETVHKLVLNSSPFFTE